MIPQEHPLAITGDGFAMLGILSRPPPGQPEQHTALLIVAGGAQYRVGSHRQFVLLARRLAAAGYPTLRFDLPGMGDSPSEPLPFEDTAPHIRAALDATLGATTANRVVLWGLCDGASASLLYVHATQDPRVAGLALLNPWVRSEAGLARVQVKHYYRQRLLEPTFWQKLLRGGVGWQALRGLADTIRQLRQPASPHMGFQRRMAQGWSTFHAPILLLTSELDLTAQEFLECATTQPDWSGSLQRPSVRQHTLAGADHTCSRPVNHQEVEEHTLAWLHTLPQP